MILVLLMIQNTFEGKIYQVTSNTPQNNPNVVRNHVYISARDQPNLQLRLETDAGSLLRVGQFVRITCEIMDEASSSTASS